MTVVVRDAVPSDAERIVGVRTNSWQVAYADMFAVERLAQLGGERAVAWWDDVIAAPPERTHTLVASLGGDVVGFAHIGSARDEPKSVGELFAICVGPDAWGLGVGRALMTTSLGRLRTECFAEAIL